MADTQKTAIVTVAKLPKSSDWAVTINRYCTLDPYDRRNSMEATSKGWSEGRNVIGDVLKFGLLVQRVRIPSGQTVDPQAGSEPCSGTGNCPVDA